MRNSCLCFAVFALFSAAAFGQAPAPQQSKSSSPVRAQEAARVLPRVQAQEVGAVEEVARALVRARARDQGQERAEAG